MNNHEFEIYLELYKRKEYKHIPIGQYSNGDYFYMTDKQVLSLELLNDNTTTHIGYGGSARCFAGDTLVLTNNGYVRIDCINKDDTVLTYNETNKKREYKKVLKPYMFKLAEPPKMIIFDNNLKCKHDHEFLFRGKWTKAIELRERAMEAYGVDLLRINERENSNIESQKHRETKIDASGQGRERIFKDNDCCEWEEQNNKNASRSCKGIYTKPIQTRNSKPQKLKQTGQFRRKSRVDEFNRQQTPCVLKRSGWKHLEERRKTTRKLLKAWGGQWKGYTYKGRRFRNTDKIHPLCIHKENACERIRSERVYYKGCYKSEVLESREISLCEFLGSRVEHLDIPIYDLHIEDNHNYVVTENNYIVHNSGKSLIECTAIIFDCNCYNDIAWGLARKELTTLKRTVLITMFNQLSFYGIKDYKTNKESEYTFDYNQQLNKISFKNKSEVFLIDTAYKPSDPLNTRFGGFELTRSAIDESNETQISVVNKLFERTGWRNNDIHGLKRKQFECFNPDKNHVYSRYWLPFKKKSEEIYKKFIRALPSDNPNPAVKEWVDDIIRTGDTATIERQIHGNFDFDDDPTKLCEYDAICDIFTNNHVSGGEKRISSDLAMQGRDRFISGSWNGLICRVAIDIQKCGGRDIELALKELKTIDKVGNSNIIADSDGLGAYLESYIKNIKTFHGGSSAINKDEFGNIKDECAFKLAEIINNRELRIICTPEQEDRIKKELSVCLKRDNVDNDKKKIIKKDKMKELLGNSPDYLDMLLMGMWFYVVKKPIEIVVY